MSDISHLGKSGWQKLSLSDLAQYINGFAFKPSDWSKEGTKIIRIEQLNNPNGEYDFFDGYFPEINRISNEDLIFSWSATLKVVIWKHGEGVLNQHLFKVIPNTNVDKYLLYFLLDFNMEALGGGSHGSTMKHIKRRELTTFKVNIPPLLQQRKIARILTTADNLIESTEAAIVKYEAIKKGMMHDLFTCGVDAHGRLRPPYEQAPELYKQSELGWIPKEWTIEQLSSIAIKIQDGTHFSPQSTTGSYRYITSKNIRFGYMDFDDCEWISAKEHESIYRRCDVQPGDVLLTKDGVNTGNACLNELEEPFSLLSSVVLIRTDGVSAHSDFILHYLLSPSCQQRIKDLVAGNAITRLTLQKINAFVMPKPTVKEQRKIADYLNSILVGKLRFEERSLKKILLIKTGLMQDLLTGKVRVKVDPIEKDAAHV